MVWVFLTKNFKVKSLCECVRMVVNYHSITMVCTTTTTKLEKSTADIKNQQNQRISYSIVSAKGCVCVCMHACAYRMHVHV